MNLSVEQCDRLAFHVWYPLLRANCVKSAILPLPEPFIEFLLSDGIEIPTDILDLRFANTEIVDEDNVFESDDEADQPAPVDSKKFFPEFLRAIDIAVIDLGGKVFPKLNWHAPTDAVWITMTKSMQCTTVGEILLLLKSSTAVAMDLTSPYAACSVNPNDVQRASQYNLVLKKWCNLRSAGEFRAFVRGNVVVGITQKDPSYFAHLQEEDVAENIEDLIVTLVEEKITPSEFGLSEYAVDVYVDQQDKVWILDFNPFCLETKSYLYTWDELQECTPDGKESVLLRVVQLEGHALDPTEYAPAVVQRLPDENVDVSDKEGIEALIMLIKLQNLMDDEAENEKTSVTGKNNDDILEQ